MIESRIGRWTVLEEAERDRHGNRRWTCRCDCGVVTAVYQNTLRSGQSTQCGACGRAQSLPKRAEANRRHGRSRSFEYRVWEAMVRRCRTEKDTSYDRYGGRGISVCNEWTGRGGFEAFFAHVGLASEGTTIDRIDNSRGYEPGNVRWASRKVQARNRRSNRMIAAHGKTQCLVAWAEETGQSRERIAHRLRRESPESVLAGALEEGS